MYLFLTTFFWLEIYAPAVSRDTTRLADAAWICAISKKRDTFLQEKKVEYISLACTLTTCTQLLLTPSSATTCIVRPHVPRTGFSLAKVRDWTLGAVHQ